MDLQTQLQELKTSSAKRPSKVLTVEADQSSFLARIAIISEEVACPLAQSTRMTSHSADEIVSMIAPF